MTDSRQPPHAAARIRRAAMAAARPLAARPGVDGAGEGDSCFPAARRVLGDSGRRAGQRGFTILELSIVLVIIGLVVGGFLAGRDLIEAAKIRSTIGQFEKFNTAVHAFQLKYGSLPGDLPATQAAALGFATRAGTAGRGDGDGLIMSGPLNQAGANVTLYVSGEELLFWNDLSTAGLIPGIYSGADTIANDCGPMPSISTLLPAASLDNNTY